MNIYEEVVKAGANRQDKTAMMLWGTDGERSVYTYRRMFDSIGAFAGILSQAGMARGFRAAIVAESCPEWGIAYLAILKAGGTPALIDASLPADDIQNMIEQCDPACIYVSASTADKLGDGKGLPLFDIHSVGAAYPGFEGRTCPAFQDDCDERVASIIFSSGTTRRASGIMHGHEAVIGSALMCCNNNGVGSEDRFLGVLPNSHIYGLYVQVIAPLILGGTVCYIESLDAACLAGALQGFKPSVFPAVPRVFELLRAGIMKKVNSDAKTAKLFRMLFPLCLWLRRHTGLNLGRVLFKSVSTGFGGHMRVMASAGAPTDRETAEFYYGVGLNLLITYGATETSIPVIGNYGGHLTTDTCGRPYPEITVSQTSSGEFLVKSPYLMLGYFRDEEATKACYDSEGWFKTGDQGFIDEKKNIHFSGRAKDNIVLSTGKKVAPDDIEAAYAGIAGVQDFVICGVPVSAGGYDTVHAFAVVNKADCDAIREAFQKRSRNVSPNMRLHGIHFVESIPKTTLQKPKRFLLRSLVEEKETVSASKPAPAKQDLRGFIIATVSRLADINASDLTGNTRIFEDLPIDSLGAIELMIEVESYLGRELSEAPGRKITIDEFINVVAAMDESPSSFKKRERPARIRKKYLSDYSLFNACRQLMTYFYNINVQNDDLLPQEGGYIICANHVTNFDYLFITTKFRKERFMTFCCMAKKELLKKNPLNLLIARIAGMIPVDRDGNASMSMKAAKEKLLENWGVLIHPEGTRSRNGEMGQFKFGAAFLALESGVPIVPAYIRGGYEVFPAGRRLPRLFNWKTHSKFKIDVIYGEPIFPENQTVDTIMQRVNSAVRRIAQNENRSIAN